MQRPSQVIITTSGNSTPIPLDRYVNGYAVAVTMPTAGIVYTLQHSFDDPFTDQNGNKYTTSYAVSGVWFNCDDPLLVTASSNRATNYAFPPRAIRLGVSSKVSAGNPLTLTIIPMGMDGN